MPIFALHEQLLPASGAAFSVACHLTPPEDWIRKRLSKLSSDPQGSTISVEQRTLQTLQHWRSERGTLLGHVVTARDDSISVYEVRKLNRLQAAQERERLLEENDGLEGSPTGDVKAYLLRQHSIFGTVTGLQAVQTNASEEDGCDRILVSFKNAKLALLEWSVAYNDLLTVSIHTYERTPEISVLGQLPLNFRPHLRTEPLSRCAALLLPSDTLAILPFAGEDELELFDLLGDDANDLYMSEGRKNGSSGPGHSEKELPYNPSFVVRLSELNAQIRNTRDFVFLPGFQKPTLALLFEPKQTCTGLLPDTKDTISLFLVTLDLSAVNDQMVLISARDSLPYDAIYLVACPVNIGGAVVVSANALMHVDQSGRVVGLAVSHWHLRVSDLELPLWEYAKEDAEGGRKELDLQGSQLIFLDQSNPEAAGSKSIPHQGIAAILTLADGEMYAVHLLLEGRSASGIRLEYIAKTVQPSSLALLPPHSAGTLDHGLQLFAGSMVGDSEILKIEQEMIEVQQETTQDAACSQPEEDEMDVDLYGPSATGSGNGAGGPGSSKKQLRLHATSSNRIPALGPISDMTISPDAHEGVPLANTVACTGARASGGLTRFEPKLKPRKRRRIDLDGSIATAIWGLGAAADLPDHDALLASCDAEHVSLLVKFTRDGVVSKTTELNGKTIFAAPFDGQFFVRVTKRKIELREMASGNLVSVVELEGDISARSASTSKHLVSVLTSAGQARLFALHSTPGITEISIEAAGDSNYAKVGIYYDEAKCFASAAKSFLARQNASENHTNAKALSAINEDEIDYGDDMAEDGLTNGTSEAVNGHGRREENLRDMWLTLFTEEGSLEVISLRHPHLRWKNGRLRATPLRLINGATSTEEEQASYNRVDDILLCDIGGAPYLAVLVSTQQLHLYECNPFADEALEDNNLSLTFVKVLGKQLKDRAMDVYDAPDGEQVQVPGARLRCARNLNSLVVTGTSLSAVIKSDLGNANMHELDADLVFDATEAQASSALILLENGQVIISSLPTMCYDLPVAYRRSVVGRTYNKITTHPATQTLVAASVLETPFLLHDPEDNSVVRDPHGDNSFGTSYRGSVELFAVGASKPHTGFALQQNEVVCALELVSLNSGSNPSGRKDYVAVGTMISHGEDRPAKGTIYLLDVVETVPSLAHPDKLKHKLKLIDREDLKGPVTALTDLNGYLVHSIGQKLQVKALENDEWLISVAFLDLAFLVTSLRRVKNYLLLSDVKRSITFVAFQEDPFRLVQLGRDINDVSVQTANFLMQDDTVGFVTTDDAGVIRLIDYAPSVLTTQGGQKLLLRTEYQISGEPSCSTVLPGGNLPAGLSHQNEILYGTLSGSLESISPLSEEIFKRLQLLQNYMTRNVQHFAGLNPRAHRSVNTEISPRPLAKGILDGSLLRGFNELPQARSREMAAIYSVDASATEVSLILREIAGQWLRR